MAYEELWEARRDIANGSIGSSYANFGPVLPKLPVSFVFVSTIDGAVSISLDGGVTDHFVIGKGSTTPFVLSLDSTDLVSWPGFGGAQVQVKKIDTLSAGNLYLSVKKRI